MTTDKLTARIESLPTAQIIEIAIRLQLAGTTESILICNRCDRVLEGRMTPEAFAAYLADLEAMLDAAAGE